MGTNYYVRTGCKEKKVCNLGCEHIVDEELHIGKASIGWKFCLHIIPEKGINEFGDWIPILGTGKIFDEYGEEISFGEMVEIIRNPQPSKCDGRNVSYDVAFDNEDKLYYCTKDKVGAGKSYVLVEGNFC